MQEIENSPSKPSVRERAEAIKQFRCKNLIAVLECPTDVKNIGTVIRNANALGVEKVYVVDPKRSLPDDWQELREKKAVSKTSVSAVKWTFVKRFDSTDACFDYLESKRFRSVVTSPHVKGKTSIFLHEGDFYRAPQTGGVVRQRGSRNQRSSCRAKRHVRLHSNVRNDREPQLGHELRHCSL